MFSRRAFLPTFLLPAALRAQPLLPNIPPAEIDDNLNVEGDPMEAERRRSRLFIQAYVNDAGPYRFLVDSGADRSVVSTDMAAALGLPEAGQVMLQSMAGRSLVNTVRVDSLRMGESVARNLRVPALPAASIGADGLLGIDALATQRILLDYQRRRVTVQSSDSAAKLDRLGGPNEIVVTARRRGGQLIITKVRADGLPLYAVIDSGSEVTLGNMLLAERLYRRRQLTDPQEIVMTSVTGETLTAQMGILPELRIGNLVLRGLPIAFADAGPFRLFGLDRRPALLLGADVLKVFRRVALDFGRRRVRFTLARPSVLGG
jgi:predicted aspartyl protease